MKAEQRHQLQTNYLADTMGKLWKGSKSSSSGMLWGVLLVIVAVGVFYWWQTGRAANIVSATWINWWDHRSSPMAIDYMPDTELEKMAGQFKGSAADNAARLTLADQLYEKGYQTTFKESAPVAAKQFEQAFGVYESLAAAASSREVGLRALVGAARCQESLGDIEKAKSWYQKAVQRYGEDLKGPSGIVHPLVAEAQERIKSFEGGAGKSFYAAATDRKKWPERVENTKKTPVGPFGEMPPVPDGSPLPGAGPPPPPTFPEGTPETTPTPPLERPAPEKPASGPEKPAIPDKP